MALGLTLKEAKSKIDSREFSEWAVFSQTEPIGADRFDILAAHICATIANCTPRKSRRPLTIKDFLIQWTPHRKRRTAKEMQNTLMAFANSLNARAKRNQPDGRKS